ncbi:BnaC03g48050D [Brassica napus]|uniref:BnaC03g48050D protein n=1 Tax=Brassica napus TaxID=3708 RepID=A0A078F403_BRANA|nr:BnaC03g48050D [Brassica napus]
MTTATSLGGDPLFLSSSSSKSDRAAAIKIRFADIIVKSSSNKSEAMMTIRREKLLLQLQEKAMIEARMKVRQEERLAIMKMEEEEEARSNGKFEQDPLSAEKAEKELLKLIGGSHLRDDEHFFIDHPVAVPIRLLPVLRRIGQGLEEPSFMFAYS